MGGLCRPAGAKGKSGKGDVTILRTARLVLRPARMSDVADLHGVFGDPAAMQYWSTLPHATVQETEDRVAAMIAAPSAESADFVIEMGGRVVGKAGFWRLPEIGYILHRDVWGQGVATEALTALLDHAFAERALDTAIADVDPRNAGSIRLLEKLGFRETHRARNTYFIGEVWTDSVYFAMQQNDWRQRR